MEKIIEKISCYHCGTKCKDKSIEIAGKYFCCSGCMSVFETLEGKELGTYYEMENNPGTRVTPEVEKNKFDYLDDTEVEKSIIDFKDKNFTCVTFHIPGMHCSSCIYLLEKLFRINPAIISSSVNFFQKKVTVRFDNSKIRLKSVVKILVSLGYEPQITIEKNKTHSKKSFYVKNLYLKIGVAGFCLGNIMLLSFPEYLSLDKISEQSFRDIFNYLNILLVLPVMFFSASDYFTNALKGLKQKYINIDLPISIGLLALFIRSLYEIIYFGNAGFVDSLAGLVFLLLIGKLFQSKTFESLNFERDYKSYLPISVTLKKETSEFSVPVTNLKPGDRIILRNNEIVPADSILFKGTANIDYSFVTGESIPEQKVLGEIIYAGGRHFGSAIELEVVRTVSRSYITQLWNESAFTKKSSSSIINITNSVSKYFTIMILLIASLAAAYHLPTSLTQALNAFTAVLIVACPCALALTVPFALGNSLRILGRNKFYLKNSYVIEKLAGVTTIIFDKTGTITNANDLEIRFVGGELDENEMKMVKSLVRNSTHPLSKKIYDSILEDAEHEAYDFTESVSEGISGTVGGSMIKLGTIRFLFGEIGCSYNLLKKEIAKQALGTNVFLAIDDQVKGFFCFDNKYREGLSELLKKLSEEYKLALISGDNNSEKIRLKKYFENEQSMRFNQNPLDKLLYVKGLQQSGEKVLMIGDGINDAGALKQSDVGITVSEDITNFSPSCDAIMDATSFSELSKFLKFSRSTLNVIKVSFAISFIYNVIGLYLASQGTFSPLIAAILMPFNSISIILFVIGMTNFLAKRKGLLQSWSFKENIMKKF